MRRLAAVTRPVLVILSFTQAPAGEAFTLGGDALLRFEAATHFDLAGQTEAPGLRPERALSRIRPTLTASPVHGLTLFGQGQWYGAQGQNADGRASLYQAYADFQHRPWTVRAGRQEIALGSGFLLGADTFLDGASFDAVRVQHRPDAHLTVDVFSGRYVAENSGGIEGGVSGAGVRLGHPEGSALEAQALRDRGEDSISLRGLLVRGRFRVELEPVRQSGGAWGGHGELTYRGVTASYARGSRGFRHPNHDTAHAGEIGILAELTGLRAVALSADASVGAATRCAAAVRSFRAASGAVGREVDLVLSRTLADRLTVHVSANRFDGSGLRALYGYLGLQLAF